MEIKVLKPMNFENGLLAFIKFRETTLKDLIDSDSKEEAFSPVSMSKYFEGENPIALGINDKGKEFKITKRDISNSNYIAFFPMVIGNYNIKQSETIYDEKNVIKSFEGEKIAKDPLLDNSIIKLINPIFVNQNGKDEKVEFIEFTSKTYGEVSGYIEAMFTEKNLGEKMFNFILEYGKPIGSDASFLTPPSIYSLSLKDVQRINGLVREPFFMMDEKLFEIVEQ